MSRMFRRKDYRPGGSWGSARYYTYEWDAYGYTRIYLDPVEDRKEYRRAVWERHRESANANERSPGRVYRKRREQQYRTLANRELQYYRRNADHEVIIPPKPLSHWWDWS